MTPTPYLIQARVWLLTFFGWIWGRNGKVENFTLRQSVGGMGKSALPSRNFLKFLLINVALLGKIFYLASQNTGSLSPAPRQLYSMGLGQELVFLTLWEEMNLLATSQMAWVQIHTLKITSCTILDNEEDFTVLLSPHRQHENNACASLRS